MENINSSIPCVCEICGKKLGPRSAYMWPRSHVSLFKSVCSKCEHNLEMVETDILDGDTFEAAVYIRKLILSAKGVKKGIEAWDDKNYFWKLKKENAGLRGEVKGLKEANKALKEYVKRLYLVVKCRAERLATEGVK